MPRPDDILSIIDAGLQTPLPDPTFGEVSPTNHDECWRCSRPSECDAGLCALCRAFMLGDSDVDPVRPMCQEADWTELDESYTYTIRFDARSFDRAAEALALRLQARIMAFGTGFIYVNTAGDEEAPSVAEVRYQRAWLGETPQPGRLIPQSWVPTEVWDRCMAGNDSSPTEPPPEPDRVTLDRERMREYIARERRRQRARR